MNTTIPWPKPLSYYDSGGPRDLLDFEIVGVQFRVAPTSVLAPSTLRTRYYVQCHTCLVFLHEATTGPTAYIRHHLKNVHGFDGNLDYQEKQ